MILAHDEIIQFANSGHIKIDPFNPEFVGPNSVDLHLGGEFKKVIYNEEKYAGKQRHIDTMVDQKTISLKCVGNILLMPGDLLLATTIEKAGSDHFVPMIEGRSSIGRMGLFVHVTAGFGDIGFYGQWTLELTCILPIKLYVGMKICQVFFHTASSNNVKYSGRYQNQEGPIESRFNLA